MTLADKIAKLRRERGWGQEELADKMQVSRQAVSKWESGTSVPDLAHILRLATLFEVSTDYLLRDGNEGTGGESISAAPRMERETVNALLAAKRRAAWLCAFGTLLCILSPVCLFLLAAASELPQPPFGEAFAAGVGLGVLFLFITVGVTLFLYASYLEQPFLDIERKFPPVLALNLRDTLTKAWERTRTAAVKWNLTASVLCILSPLPLILAGVGGAQDMLCICMLAAGFAIVGVGVMIFIVVGAKSETLQRLLGKGADKTRKQRTSALCEVVGTAYWGLLVSIYLLWSFLLGHWHISWVLFVAGGTLFPLVMHLCGRNEED